MIDGLKIRESQPGDVVGIEQLYESAFPDEDLIPLVRELLDLRQNVKSLVGMREDMLVGHISFTICHIEGGKDDVALLAPLAVMPALQNQGIGRALVQTGLKHLELSKTRRVFVLGDPAYYSRLGFREDDNVATPYPLPADWHGAWQSIQLCDAEAPNKGKLAVPEPWRHIELWS
jgi:putative acetyltransferase